MRPAVCWSRSRSGPGTDEVADLVAKRVKDTSGRISAKRLLPEAIAAGYAGSARNLRRLVADAKAAGGREPWPRRRPAIWAPGETLMIDWSKTGCTCSVRCWPVADPGRPLAARRERPLPRWVPGRMLRRTRWSPQGRPGGSCGLPEGRRGGADTGLCPVRYPLPVPPGLLRAADPESKGSGGEPRRVRQGRPDGPLAIGGSTDGRHGRREPAAEVWCAEVNAATIRRSARSPP